jgi:hypothetical protein
VPLQHEGKTVRGLLSLFTATDPDFTRQGIFRTLAARLYEDASSSAPIVFGFPNRSSAPGFYRNLGWVDLGACPVLRRPLANRHPRSRLLPVAALALRALDRVSAAGTGIRVECVGEFDQRVTALWERVRGALGTTVVRDATYLNWRFVSSPFRYRRYLAWRGDQPVGLAVLADAVSDGRAYLMELLVPGDDREAVRGLVAATVEDASAKGVPVLCLMATRRHPNWRGLVGCGFLPEASAFIRLSARSADPPPSSFGLRINGAGVTANSVLHIDDWHLSGADTDVR